MSPRVFGYFIRRSNITTKSMRLCTTAGAAVGNERCRRLLHEAQQFNLLWLERNLNLYVHDANSYRARTMAFCDEQSRKSLELAKTAFPSVPDAWQKPLLE